MPDYNPNFIKKDPVTGLTYYDFEGHVHAQGLDLPWYNPPVGIQPPGQPPIPWQDQAKIKWNRNDNNFTIGEIHTEPGGTMILEAIQDPNSIISPAIIAQVPGFSRILIDSTGYSDFAQKTDNPLHFGEVTFFAPLNSTAGADVTSSFTLNWPAYCYIFWIGTGYVSAGNTNAFLNIYVDNNYAGSPVLYFNQAQVHTVLHPTLTAHNLVAGSHSTRMSPGGNLTRDANDRSTAWVLAVRNG